jgi:calcineurin-like phosphoesterase family protein
LTIFFISDTHFGQASMLHFKQRDGVTPVRSFASVSEMDETMIANWNERVRPSDHVYHLGDFAMAKHVAARVAPRLNGHKRLIGGNHDIFGSPFYESIGFEKCFGVRVIDNLLMTHIPVAPWSFGKFRANVHGHVHEKFPKIYKKVDPTAEEGFCPTWLYVNLSVEAINYTPVSLEELKRWIP